MSEEYPLMAFIANEGVAPKGDRYDRSSLVSDTENKPYCSGPVETAAKGPAETANLSSKEKAITKTFQTPYTG